jgi:hypothetical protein
MNDDPLESVRDRPWYLPWRDDDPHRPWYLPWRDGDPLPSQCLLCDHRDLGETGAFCRAFTSIIPLAIQLNRFDHRKPWIDPDTGQPGDTGVSGERSITFQPLSGVYAHLLKALYRHLDGLDDDEGRMLEVLFQHYLDLHYRHLYRRDPDRSGDP